MFDFRRDQAEKREIYRQEIVETLGFLSIDRAEISNFNGETFVKMLPLSQFNMGIDLLRERRIVVRRSRNFELKISPKDIINELFTITLSVVRWLLDNNINEDIILCYISKTLHWDYVIECAAFRCSEENREVIEAEVTEV